MKADTFVPAFYLSTVNYYLRHQLVYFAPCEVKHSYIIFCDTVGIDI